MNYVQSIEVFSYAVLGMGVGSAIGVWMGIGASVIFGGTYASSLPGAGGLTGIVLGLVASIVWYTRSCSKTRIE